MAGGLWPQTPEFGLGIRMKGPVPRCTSSGRGLPHLPGPSQAERAPGSRGDKQWKGSPRKRVPCQDVPLPVKSLLVPLTASCLSLSPGCFSPWPPSAWPAPRAISAVHLASLSPLDPAPLATSVWQESPPQPRQVRGPRTQVGPALARCPGADGHSGDGRCLAVDLRTEGSVWATGPGGDSPECSVSEGCSWTHRPPPP